MFLLRQISCVALMLLPGCGGCGSENVVEMPAEDFEVRLAMLQARKSVGEFLSALQNPQPGDRFLVKAEIVDRDRTAWVWLTDVSFNGTSLKGNVSEAPSGFSSVRKGYPLSVEPKEIGDWLIVNGTSRRGGFVEEILERRRSTPLR